MSVERRQHTPTTQVLVRRVDPDTVPGFWVKQWPLAPHQWAVVKADARTRVLKGEKVVLGGLFRPSPKDVGIVEVAAFTLHPYIGDLMSHDDQLVEADFLAQVEVADPEAFYRALGSDRDALTVGDVEGWMAAEVRPLLARAARQYTAHDLAHVDAVAEQVAGEVRSFLQTALAPMGLKVTAVRHVIFRRAEDRVKVAEAMRALRERLRDTALRERLKALRDAAEFRDALEQIAHDLRIRQLFRQEEWEQLSAEVQEEIGRETQEATTAPSVETPDEVQKRQVRGRWDALRARLGLLKDEECDEPSPVERLERWVIILRALGTMIFFGTTLLALLMPQLFDNPNTPQLITAAAGFFLGLLAFVSAFWLRRRARARRLSEQREKALSRMGPQQRAAVERRVRERVAAILEQVESNLQEAWTSAYRRNRQDLAKGLRDLARKAARLRDDLKAASYSHAPLLTRTPLAPEEVQPWLDIDENLLVQGETLSDLSQSLYQGVATGAWDDVANIATQMDIGLQELQSRLKQRDTLLKGV